MGRGAPTALRRKLLSAHSLRHDLPELPELDNLFAPEGPILEAQALAARAFGAAETKFLVNGSTAGVLACVIACVQLWHQRERVGGGTPAGGPVVLLPRNAHKSAIHALVASGAEPAWLSPAYDSECALVTGVPTAEVRRALEEHGERVAAALLISPTYQGVVSDVRAAAELCAAAGAPLIVDEAHGAHLTFLSAGAARARNPAPRYHAQTVAWRWRGGGEAVAWRWHGGGMAVARRSLALCAAAAATPLVATSPSLARPRGALSEGAGLVVQSTHKTLGAMTQAAMVHISAGEIAARPELPAALGAALEQARGGAVTRRIHGGRTVVARWSHGGGAV